MNFLSFILELKFTDNSYCEYTKYNSYLVYVQRLRLQH